MKKLLCLLISVFSVQSFAQAAYTCEGSLTLGDKKDQIFLTINNETIDYVRSIYHLEYSSEEPVLEFQDTFDLTYWQVSSSASEYRAYDFMINDSPNIQVKIDLLSMRGSYQSYSMDNAIPLICRL